VQPMLARCSVSSSVWTGIELAALEVRHRRDPPTSQTLPA
jgi:hypothetical protein